MMSFTRPFISMPGMLCRLNSASLPGTTARNSFWTNSM